MTNHVADDRGKRALQQESMHAVARCEPQLDEWIDDPTLRVRHRRESTASADDLWRAAREVSLSDTALLGGCVGIGSAIARGTLSRRRG